MIQVNANFAQYVGTITAPGTTVVIAAGSNLNGLRVHTGIFSCYRDPAAANDYSVALRATNGPTYPFWTFRVPFIAAPTPIPVNYDLNASFQIPAGFALEILASGAAPAFRFTYGLSCEIL